MEAKGNVKPKGNSEGRDLGGLAYTQIYTKLAFVLMEPIRVLRLDLLLSTPQRGRYNALSPPISPACSLFPLVVVGDRC